VAQTRVEAAKGIAFRACAEKHIAAHEAGWRNPKHRDQWKNSLATYVYPVIGDLPVGEIDTGLVLKILEPIWTSKTETAGRVRGRLESVLDWAAARGYRSGENPARWRGHLDKLLPARTKVAKVRHHPAMPYTELPRLYGRAKGSLQRQRPRSGVCHPDRCENRRGDRSPMVGDRSWRPHLDIPAERMKAGREHRVPLSDEP
jgi:integrase